MRAGLTEHHFERDGFPAGGHSFGTGFAIAWQSGPLGRGEARREPNGAFVEDLLLAARGRLRFYQTAAHGQFACDENAAAILAIDQALAALYARTLRRERLGTEGTHEEGSL